MNVNTNKFGEGLLTLSIVILVVLGFSKQVYADKSVKVDTTQKTRIHEAYGKLPLYFIKNDGQINKQVKFYERSNGHTTFFTEEGVWFLLSKPKTKGINSHSRENENLETMYSHFRGKNIKEVGKNNPRESQFIKLIPIGANQNPEIVAEDIQKGKVNYFIGNDKSKWRTNIPTYRAVRYKSVYPGVDIKFYGNNRQFEYDIIISPETDPSQVVLAYEGIEKLEVTELGNLKIHLKNGEYITQKSPYIYQEIGGKRIEVEGKFKILSLESEIRKPKLAYTFEVASYNKDYPLIIDPILVYSTYLGGSGKDYGYDIAVDSQGNAYVTGITYSPDFPTTSHAQGSNAGDADVFITKIDSSGSSLVYSTYLGGNNGDYGYSIAVDSQGNAYVTGITDSPDFPTSSPIQGSKAGDGDAFVTKIGITGSSLVYSTYLGGSGNEYGNDIAVDVSGNAYVTGRTYSTDFPTVSPIQGNLVGRSDVFITKINSTGTAFSYSTYLGGDGSYRQYGHGIAVDAGGNAYVTGVAGPNFPEAIPIQGSSVGGVFVAKLNFSGSSLIYSIFLGDGLGRSIAVDASGNAYVTGIAFCSGEFPTVSPIQESCTGSSDAFVAKIDSSGARLIFSTLLGGNGDDEGIDIAVDTAGNVYVIGSTESTDFPTVFPIQTNYGGGPVDDGHGDDVFITKINSSGTYLVYSTYLGGSDEERGSGIAIDADGNAYITGRTYSTNFPTTSAYQGSNAGIVDAFVVKIGNDGGSDGTANGDVNGDGSITPQDALMTFQHYLGLIQLDATQQGRADVSGDGSITPADALCIFQKYLGLPSCLD